MSFDAPSAPDPIATSTAQANMNHVDQYTPQGSLKYTQESTNPDGTPHYRSDISLTPEGQATYNQQQQQDQSINNIANGYMNTIQSAMGQGLDTSGLPAMQSSASGGMGLTTNVNGGNIQKGLDFSGAPQLPGINDFSADRQHVVDNIYSRMNPELDRQQSLMDNKLANQGIMPGSEAYNYEQKQMQQQRNDALVQADLAGSAEQSRLFGLGMDARQQSVGETTSQGQFANSAQDQNFNQGYQNAGLNNTAQQQLFNQDYQNAQLANSSRAQSLAEQIQQRELPLNEFNALRSASQVQTPTFSPTPNNTDLSQGIYNNYNQDVGSSNSMMSGLFNLGSSAAMGGVMKYSDIRMKHDINRIGATPAGLGVYEFKYNGSDKQETGVMAQEVEAMIPAAVITLADGYKMVNYAMVR